MQHHTIDHTLTFMNSLLINLILLTLTNMEQLPEQNLEAAGSAPKNFARFTGKYLC